MHKITMSLMLAALFAFTACGADRAKAEASAREYAKKVPGATGEVDCVAKDSDNDGYVSCSIFRKDKEPLAVECGSEKYCAFDCAEGCKAAVAKIRGRR